MGTHHIQKQPSKQPRLEIFSTMSIQYFVLLFAAVSVLGEPLGRFKDGRKDLDAKPAVRHARSEGEDGGEGEEFVKAVEEMVERMDKLETEMSGVKTEISKYQKVLPSRDVRLSDAGDLETNSGRVEVYHEGEWGTVCDDGLMQGSVVKEHGNEAAQVVCKQLGYSSGVPKATSEAQKGTGPIWMDDVVCSGEEASLLDCEAKWSYINNNCYHSEDFSVTCSNYWLCKIKIVSRQGLLI